MVVFHPKKKRRRILFPFFLLPFRLPMHSLYSNTDIPYTHINDETSKKEEKDDEEGES